MKYSIEKTELSSSGIKQVENFSIGDMGFVLDILRNKLYSNIIAAICREYACNGRDAHREIGKDKEPITIQLPTNLDPNWRCRDFGPGISPERMSNVFVKYAASTKREDNIQTGGWGIGAKSGFGYTDSFVINTFIDGIHRSYSAVIDDSRCGKLLLLSEQPTKSPNGTEIVIPVRSGDFYKFINETKMATRHWDVKPNIKGVAIEYDDFPAKSIILSNDNWFIMKESHYERRIRLVIDGIEYPFQNSILENNKSLTFISNGTTLYLKFGIGIIPISANREQVEVTEVTKKHVTDMLFKVNNEIKKQLEDKIASCKTYIEANIEIAKVAKNVNFTGDYYNRGTAISNLDLKWNGKKLHGDYVELTGFGTASFYRFTTNGTKEKAVSDNRTGYRNESNTFPIEYDAIYCLNDLDANATESAIRAVFKGLNQLTKRLILVEIFNNKNPDFLKKNDLDELGFVKLSSYYTPRKLRTAAALKKMLFYVYDEFSAFKFKSTSCEFFEKDTNKKMFVLLQRTPTKDLRVKLNGTWFDTKHMSDLWSSDFAKDHSIYGFMEDVGKERLKEVTENMVDLDLFIKEQLESNKSINLSELKYVNDYVKGYGKHSHKPVFGYHCFESLQNNLNKINIQSSDIIEYVKKHKEYTEKCSKLLKNTFLLNLIEDSKKIKAVNLTKDLAELSQKIYKRYPMSIYVEHSFGDEKQIDMLIDYINLIDKTNP